MNKRLEITDVRYFKEALLGKVEYHSEHPSITKVEQFLVEWLNNQPDRTPLLFNLWIVFSELRKKFPYDGLLYRGLVLNEGETFNPHLNPVPLVSYTNEKEIGLYFAGKSDVYGSIPTPFQSILMVVRATNALALDDLLEKVAELTTNEELLDEIDERIWEQEKIYPFEWNAIQCGEVA